MTTWQKGRVTDLAKQGKGATSDMEAGGRGLPVVEAGVDPCMDSGVESGMLTFRLGHWIRL